MDIQPFKILLVLSDFSIIAYLSVLIYEHIYSHNNLKSFAFTFHILCLAWLSFRGVFWISTLTNELPWTDASYYFLYWMPVPLEFGSFLLLPLYFARVLYPDEWKAYRQLLRPIYVVIIVGLLSFQLIYIIADLVYKNEMTRGCGGHECFEIEISNNAFRGVTAACFLLLGIIVSICAVDLHSLEKQRYERYFSCPPEMMTYVNCALVVSFFSRSLYQILAVLKIYVLPSVPVSVDGDVPFIVFLFFELWDYVPTVLLISTITRTVGSNASFNKRNLDINQTSRKLFGPQYIRYGSIDVEAVDSEEEDAIIKRTGEEENTDLILDREHIAGIDLMRIPSKRRAGSHGSGGGSGGNRNSSSRGRTGSHGGSGMQDELPCDAAASSLIGRYLMPHSLERTESSLVPYDSARYWRNVNTPPGSNPSSLTSATGPAAGRMHGFMEGNVACAVHPSVPMNDSTRVPSAALYTSAYGSGNTGTATHSHSHSAGTSVQSSQAGSCSINGGSLLERNESIVAYYVRQRNLSITDTVLGSESSDTVSPRNCSAAPLSCRSQAQGRGNHLKPCLSPKSRGAASPASGYTDGEGSNKEVNLGIGMSPGSILPPVLELPPTTQQQQSASASTRQSLSPNPAAQTTGGSSGPHDPTEVPGPVNELCMEPPDRPQSTGHPDDQHQFQYQYQQHPPQVLYRTPSAAPHSRGVSPSWFQAPQVQIVVTSPTDVTGAGPSLSPHPPRLSPINLQGNHQAFLQPNGQYLVPSMQVTHLPGNALHIMPVYVQSPSLVHSQASSQQNDGGSLCFSQTDSPYLQGINIGGGGGSEDDPRQGPHYHEDSLLGSSTHSSATSQLSIGIGLTREELNRGFGPAGGGAGGQQQGARQGQDYVTPFAVRAPPRNGSNPPSPQLRNPRPTRPTAVAVRNLGGFDSPSQQRSALDNQSSGSSFERGTNSFSPSFIAGLDTERDSYLQHPDYQYQHQQHNRSNSSQQQHPQYYQQYQMPFPPPSPQQQHHLQQQQVKQQHQHQYQGGDAMAYAAAGMHPYSQQQQQRAARAGAVSTPERQEAARANALIRDDTRKEKY